MIGLDTGFFVELVRANQQALDVFNEIIEGQDSCVSCLTLYELKRLSLRGSIPSEAGSALVEDIMSFCSVSWLDNLKVHELAAGLSHDFGIPGIDSLILAGLITLKANRIYTTDRHIMGYQEKGTSVVLIPPIPRK
ncbi:type II toxin-antitoxin system VapC family toxin [Syntrophorhabdus aromaticivorans]|uniref:PIN domain-containing protein n=1 Tax=Syntrophorhabdus aromaticivorans TaxID=328301 RepID=A0A351U4B7_9BACT|nr:PIN domain-containing protein [Syntrophorhabdus aromaticivorans]NLW36786.1 PIN domain-containing protein [Syntrophorhabdus aromaticivorans]HBA54798.1 type II toxin-antitoxin system VapC family toxin [Syntrophorhabdus aromaticivorans]